MSEMIDAEKVREIVQWLEGMGPMSSDLIRETVAKLRALLPREPSAGALRAAFAVETIDQSWTDAYRRRVALAIDAALKEPGAEA